MLLNPNQFKPKDPTKQSHDAVVVDVKDPQKLGRVKVKIPGVMEGASIEDLPWVTPRLPPTSGSTHAPPELNSRVTVEFEGGDIYAPVYTGARPSLDSQPAYTQTNPVPEAPDDELPYNVQPGESSAENMFGQAWTSASGAQNYFRIDRNQGKVELFLGDSGTSVHIDRGGNVQIATNGNTDLKTGKLHIEATDEIFIKTPGNLNFDVGGSVHMKVEGDSSTNVAGNLAQQVGGNVGTKVGGNYGVNANGIATMHGSFTRVNEGTAPPMSASGGGSGGAAAVSDMFDLDLELTGQVPAILGTLQSVDTFINNLPNTIDSLTETHLDQINMVRSSIGELLELAGTLTTASAFQNGLTPILDDVTAKIDQLINILPESSVTNAIKSALRTTSNSLGGFSSFMGGLDSFVAGGLQNPQTFIKDLLKHHGRVMLMNTKTVAHIQTSVQMLQQHQQYLQQNAALAQQWIGDNIDG